MCTVFYAGSEGGDYFGCTYACDADPDCEDGFCMDDTGTFRETLGSDYPTGKFCQLFGYNTPR